MPLIIRTVLMILIATILSGTPVSHAASDVPELHLAWQLPDGVTFTPLGAEVGSMATDHTNALYLHRIDVRCGQATGEVAGMEQITWVEYGHVEVRDWETGDVLTTLGAGDIFGPMSDEASFFLAGAKGHSAAVYHFSAGGAGVIGTVLPEMTYTTSDCGSGATSEIPVEAATVTTLFESDKVGDSMPAAEATFYVGLLTVEPGAAIGRTVVTDREPVYTANGSGVILPLMGGFGEGRSGQAGSAGPEIGPGTAGWMYPQGTVVLENMGPIATTVLVFGVVATGQPILTGQHTTR